MGIVYLFYRILEHLGIWEKVPNIVFLGLGDAGRNTLLSRLKDEELLDDQHTLYLNGEEYRIGKIKFRAFDYDRPEIARVLRDYHIQANVPLREFEDVLLAIDGLELFISGVAERMPYGGRNQYLHLELLRLYACLIIIIFGVAYALVSGCTFLIGSLCIAVGSFLIVVR